MLCIMGLLYLAGLTVLEVIYRHEPALNDPNFRQVQHLRSLQMGWAAYITIGLSSAVSFVFILRSNKARAKLGS